MSLSLVAPRRNAQTVPGHNRWHPDIPAVAEVITGGSVRLECQARWEHGDDPAADAVLCGPISLIGAEPGDVITVDVLGLGRADGRYAGAGHPGIIGCAPAEGTAARPNGADPGDALLGHVRPGLAAYSTVVAEAVRSTARGSDIGRCAIARLTPGSRIMLPVRTRGAKLSVGDLHFPSGEGDDCRPVSMAGWIDLRINLAKRGVERFRVSVPIMMPAPLAEA